MPIIPEEETSPIIQETVREDKVADGIDSARAALVSEANNLELEQTEAIRESIKTKGKDGQDLLATNEYVDTEKTKEVTAAQEELKQGASLSDLQPRADRLSALDNIQPKESFFYGQETAKIQSKQLINMTSDERAEAIKEGTFDRANFVRKRESLKLGLLEKRYDERYFGEGLKDAVLSAIPFNTNFLAQGKAKELGLPESIITTRGTAVNDINDWLNEPDDLEEFQRRLDKVEEVFESDDYPLLLDIIEDNQASGNIDLVLDGLSLGLVGAIRKGVKTATTAASPVKRKLNDTVKRIAPTVQQANVTKTAKYLRDTGEIPRSSFFTDTDEVVEEVLPSSFKTDRVGTINYLPGRTADELADSSEEFQRVLEAEFKLSPFTDAEEYAGLKLSLETVAAKAPHDISDLVVKYDDFTTPIGLDAYVGNAGTKTPFKTKAIAEGQAKSLLPANSEYEIVKPYGGGNGWMIKLSQDVDPSKFLGKLTTKKDKVTPVGQLLGSASNLIETNKFIRASTFRSRVKKEVIEPIAKNINVLSKDKKKALSEALEVSADQDKWMSSTEFTSFIKGTGRQYDGKDWLAYKAYRELNDFDYLVRNNLIHSRLATQGFKTVDISRTAVADQFHDGYTTAKPVSFDDIDDAFVFDISKGKTVANEVDTFSALKSGDYVAVKLPEPIDVDGNSIQSLIAPRTALKSSELHPLQLGYRVGGARNYYPGGGAARFKVGQATERTTRGGGKAVGRASTTTLTRTRKEAEEFANQLEEARGLYLQTLDGTVDDAILKDKFDAIGLQGELRDWAKVKTQFKTGRLNPNNKFEFQTIKDELPSYEQLRKDQQVTSFKDDVFEDTDLSALSDTRGLYWSKRGEHLLDTTGGKLTTVDPVESLDKSLRNLLDTQQFNAFGTRSITQWVERFNAADKGLGAHRAFNVDIEALKLPPKEASLAKASQAAIKRLTNTKEERLYNSFLEGASYFIEGAPIARKLAPAVFDIGQKDPVGAIRSMAFHAYLGLGNIAQVPLQMTQGLMIASAVDDIPFGTVLKDAWKLTAFNKNPNKATRHAMAKHIDGHFKDDIDSVHFMETYDKTGFGIIEDSTALLDQSGTGGIGLKSGFFGKATGALADAGRIPFDIAEGFNRRSAFSIAYRKLSKEKGQKFLDTEDGLDALVDLTDEYNLRMLSSRQSAFQQGLLSVPTQFLSYMVRFTEAVLPTKIGGSTAFSGAEKSRMVLAVSLFGGTAGVPAATETYDALREWAGVDNKDATLDKYIRNGLFDGVLFHLSGGELNTSFGARVSPIKGMVDAVTRLADPETTFAEAALGASGSFTNSFIDSVSKIARLAVHDDPDYKDYTEALTDVLKDNVSSIGTATRAVMAMQTGIYYSRNVNKVAKITKYEAIASIFGLPPSKVYATNEMYRAYLKDKSIIDDGAKMVGSEFKAANRAYNDGDLETFSRKMDRAAALIASFPEALRADIRRKGTYTQGLDFLTKSIIEKASKQETLNPQEQNFLNEIQQENR